MRRIRTLCTLPTLFGAASLFAEMIVVIPARAACMPVEGGACISVRPNLHGMRGGGGGGGAFGTGLAVGGMLLDALSSGGQELTPAEEVAQRGMLLVRDLYDNHWHCSERDFINKRLTTVLWLNRRASALDPDNKSYKNVVWGTVAATHYVRAACDSDTAALEQAIKYFNYAGWRDEAKNARQGTGRLASIRDVGAAPNPRPHASSCQVCDQRLAANLVNATHFPGHVRTKAYGAVGAYNKCSINNGGCPTDARSLINQTKACFNQDFNDAGVGSCIGRLVQQ